MAVRTPARRLARGTVSWEFTAPMDEPPPTAWQHLTRSRARYALVAAVPLLVYGAALNPYYPPGNYDDILYLGAARAIATRGSYEFAGHHVADWPPAFSTMLAIPMWLGLDSLWIAKLLIVACAAIGSMLALRLLERIRAPLPLASVLIASLLPNALLMGSRVMSEQPFLAVSFAFLLALDRVHDDGAKSKRRALAAGALLGLAALTRSVGVLLGVAVVAQAVSRARAAPAGARLRAIAPELIVALIGAFPVLAWRVHVWLEIRSGAAVSRYQSDASFLSHVDPLGLLRNVGDLLAQSTRVATAVGLPTLALDVVLVGLFVVVVFGVSIAWKSTRSRPATAYLLATLVLFTCLEWKFPRYLLPVAPFLVSYVAAGAGLLGRAVSSSRGARLAGFAALALWATALLAMDGVLLVRGNGENHRGLSVLASPTAESFYVGYWRDLYTASRWVGAQPASGSIALAGPSDCRYVSLFADRDCADLAEAPHDAEYVIGPAVIMGREPGDRTFGTLRVRVRGTP